MKATVYIETTIVSYLTAWPSRDVVRLSHQLITRDWWDNQRSRFELFTSALVLQEAGTGDATAAAERLGTLRGIPLLSVTADVDPLAGRLSAALSLPPRARADAVHLATCAIHEMDFLLTWNCRHLANGVLADRIERACHDAGYRAPRVLTPEQLMEVP